jgi:hypothetical protein
VEIRPQHLEHALPLEGIDAWEAESHAALDHLSADLEAVDLRTRLEAPRCELFEKPL